MKKEFKKILGVGLIVATFTSCSMAKVQNTKVKNLKVGINDISFKSQTVNLAGHLHLPEGFDRTKKYPAVIFTGPLMQVKEQMGDLYGKKMADKGYVYLSFDSLGYGESGGKIRNFEQPFNEMEGIRDGISYLRTLPFVDRERLYGIGGCAGGGYMAIVAVTDKRLKAIASISGMMDNKNFIFKMFDRKTAVATFKAANEERQKQYETGKVETSDVVGYEGQDCSKLSGIMKEGCEYYMTSRGRVPRYSHRGPKNHNEYQALTSAVDFAPNLYTPYLGIVGTDAPMTAPLTVDFYNKASEPKELFKVRGATHVSLYDIDNDVQQAVEKMDEFFKKHSK